MKYTDVIPHVSYDTNLMEIAKNSNIIEMDVYFDKSVKVQVNSYVYLNGKRSQFATSSSKWPIDPNVPIDTVAEGIIALRHDTICAIQSMVLGYIVSIENSVDESSDCIVWNVIRPTQLSPSS